MECHKINLGTSNVEGEKGEQLTGAASWDLGTELRSPHDSDPGPGFNLRVAGAGGSSLCACREVRFKDLSHPFL